MENDILNTIVQAIANQAKPAVQDCYNGLKSFLTQKLGNNHTVSDAVSGLESNSNSKDWQMVLQKELEKSKINDDPEFIQLIEKLQKELPVVSKKSTKIEQKYEGDNGIQIAQVNGDVNINSSGSTGR